MVTLTTLWRRRTRQIRGRCNWCRSSQMSKSWSHHRLLNKDEKISKFIDWKYSIHTWEVVSADLLRKKLVVLLHLLVSKMAKSFVLTDVTIFCPSGCHNFLSSGCPQEGFGVRLSHSSLNQIVSRHLIFTDWHRCVPNQQISAPNKSSWHDHCQCWITVLSKGLRQNIGMKIARLRPRPSTWRSFPCLLMIALYQVSPERLDAQVRNCEVESQTSHWTWGFPQQQLPPPESPTNPAQLHPQPPIEKLASK